MFLSGCFPIRSVFTVLLVSLRRWALLLPRKLAQDSNVSPFKSYDCLAHAQTPASILEFPDFQYPGQNLLSLHFQAYYKSA